MLSDYETGVLDNSPKMVVLVRLLEHSIANGDKVLIFRLCICVCGGGCRSVYVFMWVLLKRVSSPQINVTKFFGNKATLNSGM